MRVKNTGYGGYNKQQHSTDRAMLFKRKFKAGQLLKGKVLRVEQEGYAWVIVGGMELLAEIETIPQPGHWLDFLVLTLEPSIILRQLQHGTDPRSGIFLRDYIRSYLTERDKLDLLLSQQLWGNLTSDLSSDNPIGSHKAFLTFLPQHPTILDQFTRVTRLLHSVQQMVDSSGHGSFYYMPWLIPSGRGVEVLCSSSEKNICTITAGAIFNGAQHTLIRGQMTPSENIPTFAYRLLLDKNCKAGDNTPATILSSNLTCLGIHELPSGAHDILSMIFKEIPTQRRGLDLRA